MRYSLHFTQMNGDDPLQDWNARLEILYKECVYLLIRLSITYASIS